LNGFFKFVSYAFLFLVFAFAAFALYSGLSSDVNTTRASSAPVAEVTEHTVTVTSDPPGASVFWGGESYSLNVTPVSVLMSEGVHSYRVAFEDYEVESNLYKPYRGKLNVTKDESVDVWLDRRTQALNVSLRAPPPPTIRSCSSLGRGLRGAVTPSRRGR